jgi:hypothetical protein
MQESSKNKIAIFGFRIDFENVEIVGVDERSYNQLVEYSLASEKLFPGKKVCNYSMTVSVKNYATEKMMKNLMYFKLINCTYDDLIR